MLSPWTLEDAATMVRELRPMLKDLGYLVTVGGGVLDKGSSHNDLDLFLLPIRSDKIAKDPQGVVTLLMKLWGYYRDLTQGNYIYNPPVREDHPVPPPIPRAPRLGGDDPDDDNDDDDDLDPPDPEDDGPLKASEIYKYAMSFARNGDDKIDVFIIDGV